MPTQRRDTSAVYQLKVTLQGSKPPICRRLHVRGSTTLADLHRVFQIAMGWTDSHLHLFRVGAVEYGDPDPESDMPMRDERRVRVEQIATAGERFTYAYDFGDGWEHRVLVERVLAPEPDARYPLVLTGKRACPPEDVGGIGGYGDFLAALADPEDPEHATWTEWIGGAFDPDAFDGEAINRALRRP